jgi:hypothetical protein
MIQLKFPPTRFLPVIGAVVGLAIISAAEPASAQFVSCPPGYYYAYGPGCVPAAPGYGYVYGPGYGYAPPVYDSFGLAFGVGGGRGGGGRGNGARGGGARGGEARGGGARGGGGHGGGRR